MRLLTGSQNKSFQFVPESIASFGLTVLVEGCDRDCSISWVHAWTVASGVVTGVREYFNTTLTVLTWNNTATKIEHHQASRVIGTGTFGCGSAIVEGRGLSIHWY
ncbi:hypothetical protein D8674_008014 [Pyrus ussuriensis x Pyrus communis]|uniref:Wound-induced protein 1-like n=2 Tax=Pyrus TaxID=3766 RepID=A0A5N5HRN4_9ROSA|nr:hypothetical protein D8674_008014 [Pyrus ussuriensis x Pyrus communis]